MPRDELPLNPDSPNGSGGSPARVTLEWTVFVSASVLCGLCSLATMPWLVSARGGFGPTLLQAASPGAAVVAVLLALIACTVIGSTAGRVLGSPGKGMITIGLGLIWLGWKLDGIEEIVFSGSLRQMAMEGLLWALAILIMTVVVFRVAGPLRVVEPRRDHGETDHWATSPAAGLLLASAVVSLPLVWVVAQSAMRGQVLAAVVVGAIGAGMAGRWLAPHVQPILLAMAVVLAGALAQWALALWIPAGEAGELLITNAFPNLLLPTPLDWAAGALVGVPIGLSFGNSFLQHEPDSVDAAVA